VSLPRTSRAERYARDATCYSIRIMRIAFLAMFLIITQAALTMPRQGADKALTGRQGVEQGTENSKPSAAAPIPAERTTGIAKETHASNIPSGTDTEKAIRISELPTVVTRTSRWDHVNVIFAGLLVLIGFLGTCLALRTLRALERQTQALVEAQRPRLIASGHGDPTETLSDRSARRVEINLENKGILPAHDLIYESWMEILKFPFIDFTSAATYFKSSSPMTLYGGSQPMVINIPIMRDVADDEVKAVVTRRLYVCIRIHVTYRDAFGKRHSNFGYYVQKQGFGFLPKYNDSA